MNTANPPVFDGHNDALETLYVPGRMGRDLLTESAAGHLDLPRAARGGFGGGLFAIFVPAATAKDEEAAEDNRPHGKNTDEALLEPIDPTYARKLTAQV